MTARMTGVIFSDLGLASSFMKLDWVRFALRESLGFVPFPATLNVRPKSPQDAETWRRVRHGIPGVPLASAESGFCSAQLYPVEIAASQDRGGARIKGAVLLPHVKHYPEDKIEIVAPMRLKEHLGLQDGDALTLEFP